MLFFICVFFFYYYKILLWVDLLIFLYNRMWKIFLFKVLVIWCVLDFKLKMLMEECLVNMCVLLLFLVGVLGFLNMEIEELVVYFREFIL